MSASPDKLAALRHLLAERFPSAEKPAARVLATGIQGVDTAAGGLPLSAITEIVCAAPSCGGHLILARLLEVTRLARGRVALIDALDTFDPASFSPETLTHLLWVRCRTVPEALQVADLLARDANLALVVLDLRRAPESALRRTPATQWYRLQRAVEGTDLALVVETPFSTVPSAQLRLELRQSYPLSALEHEQEALLASLTPAIQRQRLLFRAG